MSRLYYPQCRAVLQVIFDGFGSSSKNTPPKIIPVMPQRCTIHKNSYKQADSWELTFDARDLPIDPDLIAGGAVEIWLFQTHGIVEDERVINRKLDDLNLPSFQARDAIDQMEIDLRRHAAIDRFTQSRKPNIAGLFDETNLELSSSGRWVTIQGQDYTDHLMKLQYPPDKKGRARRIPSGRRVDIILRELLAEADPTGRLKIDIRGIRAEALPVVGAQESKTNKRGIPVDSGTNYWDVMYKLAIRYGLILFVDGLDVVLSRPRNITDKDSHRVRKFAWGHNIENMELKRKLSKEQVPQIIVQGYDERGKASFTETYPPESDKKPTGIDVNRNEYQLIPAYGITDRRVLREMAENFYNLIGRSERIVTMTTRDLKDMREDNLLDLVAGDAVTIRFDPFNREVMSDPKLSEDEKVAYLVARGYNSAICRTIAESYQRLEAIRRPLRVREATYEFATDSGVSIEIELVDFVVVDGDRLRRETSASKVSELVGSMSDAGVAASATREAP